MNKAALSLWLATATLAPVASAQTTPPSPTPRGAAPAQAAPTAAPVAPAAAQAADPTLPKVEDPMLVPSPAPLHVLQSWQEALGLVRGRSVQYRIALAQIDAARARSREALSFALPQLGSTAFNTFARYELLSGTVTNTQTGQRIDVPITNPTLGAGLTLNVPIFAPKAWYDRGTAERAIDYATISSKEAERQVIASIADTIVGAVVAERLADVTKESLSAALSTLDLNRRRSALGASSSLDVLRAEQEVQLSRAQVVTANEALLRARESLGLALGFSEGWAVNPDVHLDALGADARKTCRQETDVAKRSDVRAATANVALVERQKGSVDWAFWPTVNATSVLQTTNTNVINTSNGKAVSWTVGANLVWTLYDGGLRYGQRDEAAANARVAREQLNDTRRRAELQVTQAFRSVTVAETNLAVSSKGRDIAAETARLARVAFINGSGTSFDLVDTASKLRQAEIDLTVKQFDLLRAKVAALLALASCDI
jgi:multidrug efflux system outer membrane protein